MTSIIALREQIVKQFGKHWSLNDPAHQIDHFEEVYVCARILSDHQNGDFDPKLMLFTAYFHDLFAWSRINHHELSRKWVQETDYAIIKENLSDAERKLVADACGEHRASYTGAFSSPFSELMNSADRGVPRSAGDLLARSMEFTAYNNPGLDKREIYERAVVHVKDKFAKSGYARMSPVYLDCFAEALDMREKEIAAL